MDITENVFKNSFYIYFQTLLYVYKYVYVIICIILYILYYKYVYYMYTIQVQVYKYVYKNSFYIYFQMLLVKNYQHRSDKGTFSSLGWGQGKNLTFMLRSTNLININLLIKLGESRRHFESQKSWQNLHQDGLPLMDGQWATLTLSPVIWKA